MAILPTIRQIPVERLYDEDGQIEASRERSLSRSDLREMLRKFPVEFYVADVGHPLKRIDVSKCYEFWKAEVQPHIVDNPSGGFYLNEYPGEYAYLASEWSGQIQTPIVLLEKCH